MLKLIHHDASEPVCRLCGCTEGATCSAQGCCMVYDPAGGDLCVACADRVYQALKYTLEGLAQVMGGPDHLAAINDHASILIRFSELDHEPPPATPALVTA